MVKLFHRLPKIKENREHLSSELQQAQPLNSFMGICEITLCDYLKGTIVFNKNTAL